MIATNPTDLQLWYFVRPHPWVVLCEGLLVTLATEFPFQSEMESGLNARTRPGSVSVVNSSSAYPNVA